MCASNVEDLISDLDPKCQRFTSRLTTATAAPLAPLLLTIFPLEELIMRLVKIVF